MSAPIALALRGTDRVISLEDGARLTVGRVSPCDVQLEDPSVSRRHCTVEVHGER
jgi:pSer/pThr/pTyr-binding forkhead associated (FHA) protein